MVHSMVAIGELYTTYYISYYYILQCVSVCVTGRREDRGGPRGQNLKRRVDQCGRGGLGGHSAPDGPAQRHQDVGFPTRDSQVLHKGCDLHALES